jgi:hypothetical protein
MIQPKTIKNFKVNRVMEVFGRKKEEDEESVIKKECYSDSHS